MEPPKARPSGASSSGATMAPTPPPLRPATTQAQSSSAPSYNKPSWSMMPTNDRFSFEVIKNGVVVDEIPLKGREYFRVGRQPDIVDIPMEHASISRLHAIINFHVDGNVYIIDNRSANGTFVNKQRLPPNEYRKLAIGDIVRFGESTRMNVLKGPEAEDIHDQEEDAKVAQLQKLLKENADKQKREQEKEYHGMSWGMQDDAEEPNGVEDSSPGNASALQFKDGKVVVAQEAGEEDERFRRGDGGIHAHRYNLPAYLQNDENYDRKHGTKFEVDLDESLLKTEKDREIAEKVRRKERKIQNMQEEVRRIYLKEHQQEDGLTTGQLAVISRNDKAITEAIKEVNELLKRFQQKQVGGSNTTMNEQSSFATKKRTRMEDNDDDMDSQLLDTSASTADVSTNWRLKKKLNKLSTAVNEINTSNTTSGDHPSNASRSLTYKEIKDSVDRQQSHIHELISIVDSCQKELMSLSAQQDNQDDVSKVIGQNRIREIKSKLARYSVEQEEATMKMNQLQKLLHIAAPSLKMATTSTSTALPTQTTSTLAFSTTTSGSAKLVTNNPEETTNMTADKSQVEHANSKIFSTLDTKDYGKLSEMEQFMKEEDNKREVETKATTQRSLTEANQTFQPSKKPRTNQSAECSSIQPAVSKVPSLPTSTATNSNTKTVKGPMRPPVIVDDPDVRHITDAAVKQGLISRNQVSQGGEMIWMPPKQQKGDGKTSLNEKLGY